MSENQLMTTSLALPDELLRQVESHAAREGSDLNMAIASLLRLGLAEAASIEQQKDQSKLHLRNALTQKFIWV